MNSPHVDRASVDSVVAKVVLERGEVANMWDFEEREIWIELFNVIQDGCSRYTPSEIPGESANRDGSLGCMVLDVIYVKSVSMRSPEGSEIQTSFIQNDAVELDSMKRTDVFTVELGPPLVLLVLAG